MNSSYTIAGTVMQGKRRGKELGYPTSNIPLTEDILSGIYISITQIDSKEYQSITFIGAAETFNKKDRKAETHIFN